MGGYRGPPSLLGIYHIVNQLSSLNAAYCDTRHVLLIVPSV